MSEDGFDISSDARLKAVKEVIEPRDALRQISELKVTDYHLRDWIGHGRSVRRGLLAQEVEKVLPLAVSQQEGFVPDVYQPSQSVVHDESAAELDVTLKENHGVKVGDRVKIMYRKDSRVVQVVRVPGARRLVVSGWTEKVDEIFVYGSAVTDLRKVDYNRVYTTGIAAIQEVNRKLDASNKQLQSEVAAVRGENTRLNELLASVMQRL